jgi:hypothetical protein
MDNIVFVKTGNAKTIDSKTIDTKTIDAKTIDAKTIKNNLINQQPLKIRKQENLKSFNTLNPIIKNSNLNSYSYSYTNFYSCICSCICCKCYNKENLDSRCCGICFYCGDYIVCDNKDKCCYNCIASDIHDVWCLNNPNEYFKSGLFLSSGGYGNETDCCCTLFVGIIFCKFVLTLPCLICSSFNGIINCICRTNRNYLF